MLASRCAPSSSSSPSSIVAVTFCAEPGHDLRSPFRYRTPTTLPCRGTSIPPTTARRQSGGASSALDDDHEVVRTKLCCAICGSVEAIHQLSEGADELLPSPLGLQHRAGADERTEVHRVLVDGVVDRVEVEVHGFRLDRRLSFDRVKDIVDVGFDSPQRRGCTPGGGGGINDPVSVNSSPTKPSSTQVVIAIRPPGRQTRTSSPAVR